MSATREDNSLTGIGVRMTRAWNRFWFTPADPTMLGMIRICAGLVVLYVHLAYTYDLQAFFGPDAWLSLEKINESRKEVPWVGPPTGWDPPVQLPAHDAQEREFINRWGVHPSQVMAYGQPIWSIYFHVTEPTWMWVVHGSILTSLFLFTIGFCTRVTSVLTWIGMLCYIQRAPTSLFGMDQIMIVAVLYLMIGPSGAALSVDRLVARYWATYRALRKHAPAPQFGRPAPLVSANVAIRLLQVHVCIIYAASGLSKLQGGAWWSGVAVWGTMANYEFSPMQLPIYMAFLRFISQHRWLWELVMTGGSYFTLVFEVGFLPVAFFTWILELTAWTLQGMAEDAVGQGQVAAGGQFSVVIRVLWTLIGLLRLILVLAAVLLHVGIAICMGLVTFSLMMLTLVLAFVPASAVHEFLWRLGRAALRGLPSR